MKEEIINKILSKQASISKLALEYQVSRQTIHKWIKRYKEHGVDGLVELSRRPHNSPNRITKTNLELVLNIREEHRAWGGRKLRQKLINNGYDNLPCESTFNRVLKKNGLIDPIESEKRK